MSSYLFKNALLAEGWKQNVRVSVEDGILTEIQCDQSDSGTNQVLECVIPSLPNSHSHVFQRAMAGMTEYKTAENDSFWSWRDLMYRYANQIHPQQLYDIARYTYSEMLEAGYSSVCEFHYVHRDRKQASDYLSMSQAILQAANDVGMSITLLPVLYTQSHMNGAELNPLQKRFELSVDEYLDLHHKLQPYLGKNQRLGVCFHSLRAVSLQQMKQVLDALGEKQPIHIHIAEQQAEIDQCLEVYGKRPVEWLYENFDVNSNWSLIHATHLSAKELSLIANSKAIAGICPLTEANLGDGVFPLKEFIEQKGDFSIGSDSHIHISPFLELQTLEYSQRLMRQQRIIASTAEVHNVGTFLWNEAVDGGAKSCQLNVNGLHVGHQANWMELDTEHPIMTALSPQSMLDSALFTHSDLIKSHTINGMKLEGINTELQESYKNTLKSLR